ncbi:MAG: Flp pilus assembly protein CpaB [Actinobacteria bacterium]|nr:Flp pilus assembly protein CpaB [Actinomycetota bacterium]
MKGRGLVVFLALILATLATAGVFMYSRGVQEEAKTGGTTVPVVVTTVDIPARTDLDQLIRDDQFKIIQVPASVVVDGAVTSVDQLAGKNNSVAILAGEQIPVARISGNVPGGALAIPEGMQAITVSLDAPRGVAGAINSGDHVTIYSTFKNVSGRGVARETVTVVLVPTAELLAVFRPFTSSTFGGDEAATTGEQLPGSLTVTVALTPEDAQRFVFSMESGSVWFGLLPPDDSGQPMEPITYAQVVT